jgi:hypothetical protein
MQPIGEMSGGEMRVNDFKSHPPIQGAVLDEEYFPHPSRADLPD